jgi:hypothetical protein
MLKLCLFPMISIVVNDLGVLAAYTYNQTPEVR